MIGNINHRINIFYGYLKFSFLTSKGMCMARKLTNFFVVLSYSLLLSACFSTTTIRADNSPYTTQYGTSKTAPGVTARSVYTKRFGNGYTSRRGNTLHAVIVADTSDGSIGQSVSKDLKHMEDFINSVARHTGLSINGGAISGSSFSKSNILSAVNDLPVTDGDVVWFYNSSHGDNDNSNKWPDIDADDGFLPINKIADIIRGKNPRFAVVIADVCNKYLGRSGRLSARIEGNPQNYKELFLNYQGNILVSSSKQGQFSWGNPQIGGLFTDQLLRELETELTSSDKPNWNQLMSRATQEITQAREPQNPQAEVNVTLVGAGNWEASPDCRGQIGSPDCPINPGARDYNPSTPPDSPYSKRY